AHQAITAGRQVAWMAPTELLAGQHLQTMAPWARRLGIEVALLTASTPRGAAQSTLARLAAGALPLVVGTHALLAESVVMPGLGLVIIDEQHRFGVAQRVRLRDKGEATAPHLLVMTATPIPRTLALTAYGDLDVTVVDEMPPGRTPVVTKVVAGARGREQTYRRLRERLAEGARAFVVCPLVEAREDAEGPLAADATAVAGELAELLAPAVVELVHGRMAAAERDVAMARFRGGQAQVLVATTVIEVGVDVPEATIMIVEDADRFGLAQLHQLRGRVGRGGGQAWCLLLQRGRGGEAAAARLAIMAESQDGFRIAEEDLRLRGPGELLGIRQAGLPRLRFGDLREHTELLLLARSEADRLLAADPALARPEHAGVARALAQRTADAAVFGPESG
ncbi:MAG TPA: helicase-related protein, partial [Kofleriaceae bacterium]|nr:helicase-related protein [Kofleriaceae bacterium]